jgi:hypothetical protein
MRSIIVALVAATLLFICNLILRAGFWFEIFFEIDLPRADDITAAEASTHVGGKNRGRPDLRDFPLISTYINHAGQAVPLFLPSTTGSSFPEASPVCSWQLRRPYLGRS